MDNFRMIKPAKVDELINKFCMTIGMLPTSYKLALTYEEQLLCIGKYLDDVVIPALNNNAEAVVELQTLFTQLKDYVENYFEDLDVQEEINNKIQEMADSGQLVEIISEYLRYASVLAYKTKGEMKTATNIIEGNILRTAGFESYNDGKGAFYYVRQLRNTDVIDEENIIALNDELLVAELLPDLKLLNIQDDIEETNERIDTIEESINEGITLFIGDSYANGVTNTSSYVNSWVHYLKILLGLNDSTGIISADNGTGFYGVSARNKTFITLLQEASISEADRQKVKRIIVMGGRNDAPYTPSNIINSITTFCNNAKQLFPNAKIYIGMVGGESRYDSEADGRRIRMNLLNNALAAYTKGAAQNGAIYLNGVENILKDYSLISNDYAHPTQDGYKQMAQYVYQSLLSGKCTIIKQDTTIDLENSNFASNTSKSMYSYFYDNIKVLIADFDLRFTSPVQFAGAVDIGQIRSDFIRSSCFHLPKFNAWVRLTTSDSKYYGGVVELELTPNNMLRMNSRMFANNGNDFPNINNVTRLQMFLYETFPTSIC